MANKGIVYSMDTVFAIYIIILSVSTFTVLINYTGDFGEQDLELTRIARDAYNIQSVHPAAIFPDGVLVESDCNETEFTGHAFVVISDRGSPKIGDFVVCINE